MSVAKLVNIGSLCIDHVYRVPRFALAGETLASTSHDSFPGGKGLNQSLAASKAGAEVVHVGCVGADGAFLVELLADQGVGVDGIRVLADETSGQAVIQVNDNGENSIVIAGGANRHLDEQDFQAALAQLQPEDWLLLQNEINNLPAILDAASNHGVNIAFNVAPVDGREAAYDLSAVDLLIVNEIEARALINSEINSEIDSDDRGEDDESIAWMLSARLPETEIILTRGARGLIRAGKGDASNIAPIDVTAVDETAAGDAFIGYLMAGILAGETLDQALRQGAAAGALAVTRHGAASSIPERSDVDRLLNAGAS